MLSRCPRHLRPFRCPALRLPPHPTNPLGFSGASSPSRGRLSLSLWSLSLSIYLSVALSPFSAPLRQRGRTARCPVKRPNGYEVVVVRRRMLFTPGKLPVGAFQGRPAPKARSIDPERGNRARYVFSPPPLSSLVVLAASREETRPTGFAAWS